MIVIDRSPRVPMFEQAKDHYAKLLSEIEDAGLYKHERIIDSPQGAEI